MDPKVPVDGVVLAVADPKVKVVGLETIQHPVSATAAPTTVATRRGQRSRVEIDDPILVDVSLRATVSELKLFTLKIYYLQLIIVIPG